MRIYTSSYSAWRPELGVPVVTSLGRPKWLPEAKDWPSCSALTPRWRYFRDPPDEFQRQYLDQLQAYGVHRISRELTQIARGWCEQPVDALVLLCFESVVTGAECHRILAASFMLQRTGELWGELVTEPAAANQGGRK